MRSMLFIFFYVASLASKGQEDCFRSYMVSGNKALESSDFTTAIREFSDVQKNCSLLPEQRKEASRLLNISFSIYKETLDKTIKNQNTAIAEKNTANTKLEASNDSLKLEKTASEEAKLRACLNFLLYCSAEQLRLNSDESRQASLRLAYAADAAYGIVPDSIRSEKFDTLVQSTLFKAIKATRTNSARIIYHPVYRQQQIFLLALDSANNKEIRSFDLMQNRYKITKSVEGEIQRVINIDAPNILLLRQDGIAKLSVEDRLSNFEINIDSISCHIFIPNKNKFVLGMMNGHLMLYSEMGVLEHIDSSQHGAIISLSYNDVSDRILSLSLDQSIHVFSIDEAIKPIFKESIAAITLRAQFSPDGQKIVFGDVSGNVGFLSDEGIEYFEKCHESPIGEIFFSRNGIFFVSLDAAQKAVFWTAEGKRLYQLESVQGIRFAVDDTSLWAWTSESLLLISSDGKPISILAIDSIKNLDIDSQGQYLIITFEDNSIKLYDLLHQSILDFHDFGDEHHVINAAFLFGDRYVIAYDRDGTVVWRPMILPILEEFNLKPPDLSKEKAKYGLGDCINQEIKTHDNK